MRKMRENMIRMITAACTLLLLAMTPCVLTTRAASDDSYYVRDDADLLTDAEESQLASRLRAISFAHACDVVIYTTDADISDADFPNHCAERYEANGYGSDGVQYSIGVGGPHGKWDLHPVGKCVEALDDEVQEIIYEDVIDYLSAGYFYDAFMLYADDIEFYLNAYAEGGVAAAQPGTGEEDMSELMQSHLPVEKPGISVTGIIMSLLGSLGISGASVSAMKRGNKSVYRASGARSYLVQSSLAGTLQQTDTFLNNNIIKTPIAVAVSNSPSSRPGGMGGTSSRPRPTHTYRPTHRPPMSSSGTFRRTGGGGSHGKF